MRKAKSHRLLLYSFRWHVNITSCATQSLTLHVFSFLLIIFDNRLKHITVAVHSLCLDTFDSIHYGAFALTIAALFFHPSFSSLTHQWSQTLFYFTLHACSFLAFAAAVLLVRWFCLLVWYGVFLWLIVWRLFVKPHGNFRSRLLLVIHGAPSNINCTILLHFVGCATDGLIGRDEEIRCKWWNSLRIFQKGLAHWYANFGKKNHAAYLPSLHRWSWWEKCS